MTQSRGKFQGYIMGDAGSYAVYQDEQGRTLGYGYDFDAERYSNEPDFIGTEAELRRLAKAKEYGRGSAFAAWVAAGCDAASPQSN